MGMDASAYVWVGIKEDSGEEGISLHKLQEILPAELFDEYGDLKWRDEGIREMTGGFDLTTIHCYEDIVGFGIEIFSTCWGQSVEFDLDKLKEKEQKAKEVLTRLFKEWGVEAEIGTWANTDYS